VEPVSVAGITFDALIISDETWSATVPQYPTEDGFEVTDTIINHPKELSLELFLTNQPVTWKDLHGVGPGRVQEIVSQLEEIYLNREPILVTTVDRDYEDMCIEVITLPKRYETGKALKIPIKLKQVTTTAVQTASLPPGFGKGGASGASGGTAGTSTTGDNNSGNEGGGSLLYNLVNGPRDFVSNAVNGAGNLFGGN